jgi:hypothetical protein
VEPGQISDPVDVRLDGPLGELVEGKELNEELAGRLAGFFIHTPGACAPELPQSSPRRSPPRSGFVQLRTAAHPAGASLLQSLRPVRRVAELGSFGAQAMSLSDTIAKLRSLNESVPRPARLPSQAEITQAEAELGVVFHADLRSYLREASDVVFGTREPVTLTIPNSHTDLRLATREAWDAGVPGDWIPVCEDNGDFYCVRPDGSIAFWARDGASDETWPSLAAWIEQEWIGQ